jgi:hypothetical protein
MAIKRIRIDYTVYPPDHTPDGQIPCWDYRTFERAKRAARSFGVGARVYRNFNQIDKSGAESNWWSDRWFWTWDGESFSSSTDIHRFEPL